jgi:hypothetical protein
MLKKDYRSLLINVNINKKPTIMNCPNCKTAITCGCQKRTASDGKQVCSSCLPAYEKKLKDAKP